MAILKVGVEWVGALSGDPGMLCEEWNQESLDKDTAENSLSCWAQRVASGAQRAVSQASLRPVTHVANRRVQPCLALMAWVMGPSVASASSQTV